jgi:hypothetical protein
MMIDVYVAHRPQEAQGRRMDNLQQENATLREAKVRCAPAVFCEKMPHFHQSLPWISLMLLTAALYAFILALVAHGKSAAMANLPCASHTFVGACVRIIPTISLIMLCLHCCHSHCVRWFDGAWNRMLRQKRSHH